MRLDTELVTMIGVVQCTIRRVTYSGKPAFQVDLWQGMPFMSQQITKFCACVYVRWDGEKYSVITGREDQYTNALWLQLLELISNTIIINE